MATVRLPPEVFRSVVERARRAPSAHNTQPARFRFLSDGTLALVEDTLRRLVASDPEGRDQEIALGAALEGIELALSTHGYRIEVVKTQALDEVQGLSDGHRPVARLCVGTSKREDPLARFVSRRRTFRGRFLPVPDQALDALQRAFEDDPDVRVILDPRYIEHVAERYDEAAARLLADPAIHDELWAWLRLHPRHPGHGRDGMDAEALALRPWEALLARGLLHPRVFGLLSRLGLGRLLVSESAETRSASALVVLFDDDERGLETGRRFYRAWLTLTSLGLTLCPMSALADDPLVAEELCAELSPRPGARLLNVFRVGLAPRAPARLTARLPVDELIV